MGRTTIKLEINYSEAINNLCKTCFEDAEANGWWDKERNDGELIALMHSELSEALEVLRKPEKATEPVETELADCIIRIFDYCGARNLDLGTALVKKMEKNRGRGYKHGGKNF